MIRLIKEIPVRGRKPDPMLNRIVRRVYCLIKEIPIRGRKHLDQILIKPIAILFN